MRDCSDGTILDKYEIQIYYERKVYDCLWVLLIYRIFTLRQVIQH